LQNFQINIPKSLQTAHTLHNACPRTITDLLSQPSTAVYCAVQSYIDAPF